MSMKTGMSDKRESGEHTRSPDRGRPTTSSDGFGNPEAGMSVADNVAVGHFDIDSEEDFPGFDRASQQLARKRIYEFKHLNSTNNTTNTDAPNTNRNEPGSVILVEPLSHPTIEDTSKFFANDIKLAKIAEQPPFNCFNIKQITKNTGKKLLVIKIEKISENALKQILSTTQIGEWQVKCKIPKMHATSNVVIGPIGLETTDEEITEALVGQGYDNPIASRITKGKNKVPTVYMKISLEESQPPDYIYMGYMAYKTKVFIDKPWQCYKCQGFGHNAGNCNAKPHCVVCSGPHSSKECAVKNKEEMKCYNCGGCHTANYGGCPFIKHAKVIEKIRAEEKLSYREAAIKAKETNNAPTREQYNRNDTTVASANNTRNNQPDSRQNQAEQKEFKSMSTQTENCIDQIYLEPILTKIGSILTSVLLKINTNKEMENMIPSIIQKSLGLELSEKIDNHSAHNDNPPESDLEVQMEEGCAMPCESFPIQLEIRNSNKSNTHSNDNTINISQKRLAQSPISNINPTKKSNQTKSKSSQWNNSSKC